MRKRLPSTNPKYYSSDDKINKKKEKGSPGINSPRSSSVGKTKKRKAESSPGIISKNILMENIEIANCSSQGNKEVGHFIKI